MTGTDVAAGRLVIADSRKPDEPPLQGIIERAVAAGYDVRLIATLKEAIATISTVSPVAVLAHANLDPAPGAPPAGPLLASVSGRDRSHPPFLLYSGNPRGQGRMAAELGVRAPVVLDRRLVKDFDRVLHALLEHSSSTSAVRRAVESTSTPASDAVAERFRIDRWLGEAERAILLVAIREHPSATEAAAAVCMPAPTFVAHLERYGLKIPDTADLIWETAPMLLWVSSSAAPEWACDACKAMSCVPKRVAPGMLHPASLLSTAVLGAMVEPTEVASAIDAWVLHRSVRPFVIVGSAPTPVKFLLDELRIHQAAPGSAEIACDLRRAGRAAQCLYEDESLRDRHELLPGGSPAWPLDLPELLRKLDGRMLRLADETFPSAAAAARAVGLPDATYRRRLRRAERWSGRSDGPA